MARATIANYSLPDYAVDPDQVEALLLDEASRALGQVPGLLPDPAPSVSLIPGFGEYSLDFTVGYQVGRFVDQFQVQHELRKRILRRLHREGITVPTGAASGAVRSP